MNEFLNSSEYRKYLNKSISKQELHKELLSQLADSLTYKLRQFAHSICEERERSGNLAHYYLHLLDIPIHDQFVMSVVEQLYEKLIKNTARSAFNLEYMEAINLLNPFYNRKELERVLEEYVRRIDPKLKLMQSTVFLRSLYDETLIEFRLEDLKNDYPMH